MMRLYLLCFAILVLLSAALYAEDLPPSWRGGAGSTFQQWKFDDNVGVSQVNNPYSSPMTDTSGSFHIASNTFRPGVLVLNPGWMVTSVPTGISGSGGSVLVSFQITYLDFKYPGDNIGRPAIYAKYSSMNNPSDFDNDLPGVLLEDQDVASESGITTTGDAYTWRLWKSVWQVEQTTPALMYAIGSPRNNVDYNSMIIDDIVIDTKTVPTVLEPSAFVALACGVVGVLHGRSEIE